MSDEKKSWATPALEKLPPGWRMGVMVCGVDCQPGDAKCNGYCVAKSPYPPPKALPPLIPSELSTNLATLIDMISLADENRCMRCGWPVDGSADVHCLVGNCSFRPGDHANDPQSSAFHKRTRVLEAVRSYLKAYRGEEPVTNHDDVQDAAAGER